MSDDFLTFPDSPRVELDRLLDELVTRAHEVLTTQGRLRALLRANQAVVENLDLPVVLRRIIEEAVRLVGADYGALGVIGPDGGLEQFIHVGVPAELEQLIGHLPEGHGLLGALIDDPRPIRVVHISDDPRSVGFPDHHPPMDSFLGVPIRVRGEIYGNLYLANGVARPFRADDEQLVIALAATAGLAIDNARLFAQVRLHEVWIAASAEITARLLEVDQRESVSVIAEKMMRLSGADMVCVVMRSDDPARLVVQTACGVGGDVLPGKYIPMTGSIAGSVIQGGQPRLSEDAGSEFFLADLVPIGPAMAVPLQAADQAQGVFILGKVPGAPRFASNDLELAADFAAQASVAMELARGRSDRERMNLLEDRTRIARDLHDHVIQQLFATGLELQSISSALPQGPLVDAVIHAVSTLDAAISQIRTAIFALSASGRDQHMTLRQRVIAVLNEVAPGMQEMPTVSFAGAIDMIATGALADDVVAVTREAVTNVVKHSSATHAEVSIAATEGWVQVDVTDNGRGPGTGGHRSGLANLEDRARLRGGTFALDSDGLKTVLRWRVPDGLADDQRPQGSMSKGR